MAMIGYEHGCEQRIGSSRLVTYKLSEEERHRILLTNNQAEYASLTPDQIVPWLLIHQLYIGSENSFCVHQVHS